MALGACQIGLSVVLVAHIIRTSILALIRASIAPLITADGAGGGVSSGAFRHLWAG